MLLVLIAEPFLYFFAPRTNAIYFHTFVPPAIIILIGLFYLVRKDKGYVEFRLPALFFCWIFLHCCYRFIGDILLSQKLSYWPLLPTISIAIFLGLYYILVDTDLRFIEKAIPIMATIMACVAFIQATTDDFRNVSGTFGNPTNLGAYLAVCLPFAFRRKYLWGLPLLIAIYLTGSASAALGAATAIIVYLFLKNKKIGITIFIILLIAGLTFVKYNPNFLDPSGKIEIWQTALKNWRMNWLIGFGPGSFEAFIYHMPNIGIWWTRTHNLIVHILHNFGVIGLAIFGAFCIKDILLRPKQTNLRMKAFASISAFAIISTAFIPHHIWSVCVILAIGLAILKKEKNE